MLGAQEGDCLPVNAEANASFIALAHPATVLALLDENERLREALAGISLATQRTDSPSHVIVQQVGREARTALGDGA
jgi:carbon monoxide dehydrogenase subunit G